MRLLDQSATHTQTKIFATSDEYRMKNVNNKIKGLKILKCTKYYATHNMLSVIINIHSGTTIKREKEKKGKLKRNYYKNNKNLTRSPRK